MNERIKRFFGLSRLKAESILRDRKKIIRLLKQSAAKARRSPVMKNLAGDLNVLFRMLKAWHGGDYVQVPWKSVVGIAAALIYFINPFDAVPDMIPVYGVIDDLSVLSFVLTSVRSDLNRFLEWERRSARAPMDLDLPGSGSRSDISSEA